MAGELAPHVIQPVWIDEDVADPGKLLMDQIRGIADDPNLPQSFICALLRKKRLMVLIDSLSERNAETQKAWAKNLPMFVRAIVVTTRRDDYQFEFFASSTYLLEALGPATLSSFIEHLLTVRKSEAILTGLAARSELLKRLAAAVTVESKEMQVTPLLARLFVDTSIERLLHAQGGAAWDALPASIPEVYKKFLEGVNPDDPGVANHMRNEDMLMAAQAVAIEELGEDYRAKPIPFQDARSALRQAKLPEGGPAVDSIRSSALSTTRS